MRRGAHPSIRLLGVLAMLAVLATGRTGRAQDEDEHVEAREVPPAGAILADDTIDRWVFGPSDADAGGNPPGHFRNLLKVKVAEVIRICGATEAQTKKLELAGQGDIKRLFDRIEEIKRKHHPLTQDPQVIKRVMAEIQPLQDTLSTGLFSEGSMFAKTVRRALSEEQLARFEQEQAERRRFRYRAQVDSAILTLDALLGLTADQRRRLAELLRERTRPPNAVGPFGYQVVLYQASRLPRDELRPIFDDAQWHAFGRELDKMKGWAAILKSYGYSFEDDDERPTTDRKETAREEPRR